jgi:hypothetical protein
MRLRALNALDTRRATHSPSAAPFFARELQGAQQIRDRGARQGRGPH